MIWQNMCLSLGSNLSLHFPSSTFSGQRQNRILRRNRLKLAHRCRDSPEWPFHGMARIARNNDILGRHDSFGRDHPFDVFKTLHAALSCDP